MSQNIKNAFQEIKNKQAFSWAIYDFGSSSFNLLVMSLIFPIYFKQVVFNENPNADFILGLIISISMFFVAFISPLIGSIADMTKKRKNFFLSFTLICILALSSIYFINSSQVILICFFFIISLAAYELSITLYNSLLPHITSKKTVGLLSGLSWGFGYLGGSVSILLFKPIFTNPDIFKITFIAISLYYLIFTIPSFFFIKEKKNTSHLNSKIINNNFIISSFKSIFNSIKLMRYNKKFVLFLLGIFFLLGSLYTFTVYISLYLTEIFLMTRNEYSIILLLVQLIGFPSTIFWGYMSYKYNNKKALLSVISIWILLLLTLIFITSSTLIYYVAALIGLVLGGCQSVSRAWLSKIIPYHKRSEFFGFYSFVAKISFATFPVIYGYISISSNPKFAMGFLAFLFLISLFIFIRIDEETSFIMLKK
ncbi:MAG: MFS transporter [Nanoarchaeota archaeon]|nr:MFS transporter [Nanoarchaeota archaeon]